MSRRRASTDCAVPPLTLVSDTSSSSGGGGWSVPEATNVPPDECPVRTPSPSLSLRSSPTRSADSLPSARRHSLLFGVHSLRSSTVGLPRADSAKRVTPPATPRFLCTACTLSFDAKQRKFARFHERCCSLLVALYDGRDEIDVRSWRRHFSPWRARSPRQSASNALDALLRESLDWLPVDTFAQCFCALEDELLEQSLLSTIEERSSVLYALLPAYFHARLRHDGFELYFDALSGRRALSFVLDDDRTHHAPLSVSGALALAAQSERRAMAPRPLADAFDIHGHSSLATANRGVCALLEEQLGGDGAREALNVYWALRRRAMALDLSMRSLRTLPEALMHSFDALVSLVASECALELLPDELGDCLPALERLNVARNCLERLPESLGRATSLRHLNASSNCLLTLDERHVTGWQRLEVLRLDNNNLTKLPAHALAALPLLHYFDCSSNALDETPRALATSTSLRTLLLVNNRGSLLDSSFSDAEKRCVVFV